MKHQIRYTAEKIKQRLNLIRPLIHRQRVGLEPFHYQKLASPQEAVPLQADTKDWPPIPWDTYWGEWFTDFALASSFKIPSSWQGTQVELYLPLGESGDFSHPEAMVYVDGVALAACDRHHQEIVVPAELCDGKSHELLLHGWTGLGGYRVGVPGQKLFMKECQLVQPDAPTRELITVAQLGLRVIAELHDDDPVKGQLLNHLNEAIIALDTRDPLADAFYASVPTALERLKAGIAESGAPLNVDIIAVGHAHIDVAWLWTLAHTRHKTARTFKTALNLMQEFPDYHFSQSQAQLYQYIEEDHPEMFAAIGERIKEGRWEVMGGTWVEPDCNAIGAESLARQFLLGIQYFRERFGDAGTPVLWLPDTFGYAWSLPQLIREAGFKSFVTHKMSWNQYNRMPFQSLNWQGLDGSQVLTHFLTTPGTNSLLPYWTTYNGDLSPEEIMGTWKLYQQKESHTELITAYGYGDGGGGPTREMLMSLPHLSEHPGMPRTRAGTVREFLEGLEQKTSMLPVWNGEFYLEYHRGTYTSQSRTKRNNRKSEFLLHDAEFLASYAALLTSFDYPKVAIDRAWQLVCLNQFHDILPGSSIGPVYEDADRDYAEVKELALQVSEASLKALAEVLDTAYLAVNPTSFAGLRYAILPDSLPADQALSSAEAELSMQSVTEGTLVEIPVAAYSLTPLKLSPKTMNAYSDLRISQTETGVVMENAHLQLSINRQGQLSHIYDKAFQRQVLSSAQAGNVFQLFEDRPMNYDAWDIDQYFDDKCWQPDEVSEFSIIEKGPLRVGLEFSCRIMNSTLRQRIYLYRDSRRIDFDTKLDWHEHHMLLKVAFPVNILSTTATYDIQWGNVERPTHQNTSWDWARFETCAYKWVDLSEADYGVSLLNDCKHGHDVRDNTLRLTLHKSATLPDPNADQGEHHFRYSLLPHGGDWRSATIPQAYDLNNPVILRAAHPGVDTEPAAAKSLLSTDSENVIIETVKQAEDGQGMIVRLYESHRRRGPVKLTTSFPLAAAYRCNLLEENQELLEIEDNSLRLDIRPYQIVTLRLQAS